MASNQPANYRPGQPLAGSRAIGSSSGPAAAGAVAQPPPAQQSLPASSTFVFGPAAVHGQSSGNRFFVFGYRIPGRELAFALSPSGDVISFLWSQAVFTHETVPAADRLNVPRDLACVWPACVTEMDLHDYGFTLNHDTAPTHPTVLGDLLYASWDIVFPAIHIPLRQ